MDQLPIDTAFIELPKDWDHFELPYTRAMEILPDLENTGISRFFNGPEQTTASFPRATMRSNICVASAHTGSTGWI